MVVRVSDKFPRFSGLISESFKLAREHRRETIKYVMSSIWVFVSVSILGVYVLRNLLHGSWLDFLLNSLHLGYTWTLIVLAIFGGALFGVWFPHRLALNYYKANEVALAAVYDRPPNFVVRREWSVYLLFLMLELPVFLILYPIGDCFGLTSARLFDMFILSPFYLCWCSVIMSGSPIQALRQGWTMARRNLPLVIFCSLVSWIPIILLYYTNFESEESETIQIVIAICSIITLISFALQYEPFYRALLYREMVAEFNPPLSANRGTEDDGKQIDL